MNNNIAKILKETFQEVLNEEKTYLNPKTGNRVGYARALQLGIVPDTDKSHAAKTADKKAPSTPKAKDTSVKPAKAKKPEAPKQWWHKYTQYKLNAYPMNIPEKDVKVDFTGDVDSKAVMSWKSPATGRTVYSYTQKFLQKNADLKWDRIKSIDPKKVEGIKSKTEKALSSPKTDDRLKQACAIINIIANTGLRVGSTSGFDVTGNRGVSTLSAENITINGDTVKLNFIGKSYQDNQAEIKNASLANYLSAKMKERPKEQFLFDIPKSFIDQVYDDNMDMGDYKIKDLRTFVATKVATKILFEDPQLPPPLPDKQADIKKVVKEKLQSVFERVSEILNNTPAMAKTSYIHPEIIYGWLNKIGVEPKQVGYNVAYKMNTQQEFTEAEETENESAFDDCDMFPLPIWWDSDEWDLFPKESK